MEELKKRIFDLSVDSWQRYTETLQSLPHAWLSTVKRMGAEPAVIDTLGDPLSFNKFAAATISFSRLIIRNSPEQHIGL